METEKLKQSVLVDLRSVIQSCKGGVPLNRLQNDYKLLIGTTIPLTSLGYRTLEAFLQSVPQVIKLKKISDGQTIVEAVADSSTVHLQNLISKQKSTKTQKWSVKRYGKPALKQKSSSSYTSPRNAFTNSTGATSSASSSWSIASEVSNEKDKKEIESLKAKLAEEKDMNIKLKSRVNQLLSESEPHLEYIDEQIMIQRMKYQIGLLQKRILLRLAASPQALQVNRNLNEIVEKIENLNVMVEKLSTKVSTEVIFSGVPDGNAQEVPMCDPFKMYQQQCKETEELKKQVQLQNTQIQNIERKMQSQHQKLQNQISPSSLSKQKLKSELVEDLRMELEEHNLKTENAEKTMTSEFSQLKKRVEEEYFVHIVRESEKLKEFEKQLKAQKSHMHSVESRTQSQLQKLQNKVDAINIKNLADLMVKQLVSMNLIDISQVLLTSNNGERYIPPHRRTQQSTEQMPNLLTSSSPTTGTTKSRKKKKKTTESTNPGTITSVMRDQ